MNSCTNSKIFKIYLLLLLVFPCVNTLAQVDLKNSLPDLNAQYAKSSNDTNAVKLAASIGNFYFNNKGLNQTNTDSAYKYVAIAEKLSNELQYSKGIENARILTIRLLLRQSKTAAAVALADKAMGTLNAQLHFEIGKFYLEKGGEEIADLDLADTYLSIAQKYSDTHGLQSLSLASQIYKYLVMSERFVPPAQSEKVFAQIINACKANHDSHSEALAWYLKASYDNDIDKALKYFANALTIATATRDKDMQMTTLKATADLYFRQAKYDIAEKQLLTLLKMYEAAGYKNLQYIYDLLSASYMARANFEAAMRYALDAVKCADATGTEIGLNYMQFRLANLCRDMGLKKESLKWAKQCLESTIKIENYFPYLVFRQIATEMIKDGQAEQVLKRLEKAEKQFPPDQSKIMFIPLIKGDCYAALNKPALAEKYYLQGIDVLEKRTMRDSYYYLGNKSIAEFYVGQKQYNKAAPYLQKVFDTKHLLFSVTDLATAHQLQFKIDSSRGNYLSAIKHFETAKAMTDSIFNQVRLKQSEQLQVQFETAQRDHENLVLRNKNNLQHSELEKESLNRKLISIALLGSVLVIGLMLYLYRAKQKSNNMLRLRQDEINAQNTQLNQLLQEKEWLMKEIHHRVKNNLQIISSLLNTQSSYLDNEQALMAIRDSQNRMQAISIVHQKLYQSDDISTINVQRYIEELAHNIEASFETRGRISFTFAVDNIRLTTADTVPLGLILNEAITNSVKYAFNGEGRGIITVSMFKTTNGQYQLEVRDNGKGLPTGFNVENCTSLGINLMTGLTEQMNGKFEIRSENGTVVSVTFPPSLPELAR